MKRDDQSLRRLAIQIATQMPEDAEDARRVLDYVRLQLIEFMAGNDEALRRPNVSPLRPVS